MAGASRVGGEAMKDYEFDLNNPEHLRERAAALEHKGKLEFCTDDCIWIPRHFPEEGLLSPNRRYRPAREPKIVPYTLDTFPVDLLWVKRKDSKELWTIGQVSNEFVHITNLGKYTFQQFLELFTQYDGSPCGVKKV